MSGNSYIMGTLEGEIERLGFQHRHWAEGFHGLWRRGGIAAGARVLDAGCGPGFSTLELAEMVGETGHVTAFDRTPAYLQHLQARVGENSLTNVTIIEGQLDNVPLPFPDASFDFIVAKLVLLFIPDPAPTISEFSRLLKPGGKLLITDVISPWKFCPPTPIIGEQMTFFEKYYGSRGINFESGRILPDVLGKQGFKIKELTPDVKVASPDSDGWKLPVMLYKSITAHLVSENKMTQEEADIFWREMDKQTKNPGAFFVSNMFLHIMAIK